MIYNIKDYGADPTGIALSTSAIQAAIDTCSQNGGGTVLIEGGEFVSGGLYLKSNVSLEIELSAKLTASPDIADYGTDTHYNRYVNEAYMDRCFIFAEDCENIKICGDGIIDGNAESFPNDDIRPMLIRILRCKNVRICGLRLYNAAAWTCAFLDSRDIWAYGLDIFNSKCYNGDGLDFDGCRNVFVDNCKLNGTDDNLCLQSSSHEYPTQNIHISNCMFSSLCAGIRIGLKSIGTISDVVISNCSFENVWREGIKIECSEGGIIRSIMASNLVMRNVTRPLFVLLNNRLDVIGSSIGLSEMPEIGVMEDIHFSDITVFDTEEMKNTHYRFDDDIMGSPRFNGIRIDAEDTHRIRKLSVARLSYSCIGGVRSKDIPSHYPYVPDLRKEKPDFISENYFPDWSRTAFMDIRNVDGLYLTDIRLRLLNFDERLPYIVEKCRVVKEEIELEV